MDQDDDLLDSLLAAATDQLEKLNDSDNSQKHLQEQIVPSETNLAVKKNEENKSQKKTLQETNIFQFESNLKLPLQKKSNSVIHSGDTDSSDDEGNRNYEDQKYNQYGQEIKTLMNNSHNSAIEANSISSNHYGIPKKRVSTWKKNPNNTVSTSHTIRSSPSINNKPVFGMPPEAYKKFQDIFMDPIFGMRIVNPLVSSALLIDKMQGRLPVKYSELSRHIFAGNLKDKDWVLCAVVCSKSPPKISNKGSQYSIWTLSDLKDDIETFSLFLFSGAHSSLWKTANGTVIGILNPNIMDQKEGSKNEVSLSVSNAQKIMIFGQSKDFGICKSIKKNGDKCTAVVNLSKCEFCIYHIKQEYQKCSKRSELQANFAGQGLINLRNKVLGKNEVFYAGKSYTAIPAKKSKKLEARDHNILQNLSGTHINSSSSVQRGRKGLKSKKGVARQLDINPAQRAKDLELLKKLGGTIGLETKTNFSAKRSDEVTLEDSKATALSVINKLKVKKSESEEQVIKKHQFNLKSDLFVNVENKKIFSGNISEEVSLEESKNRALDVISKLKVKSQKTPQIGGRVIKNAENENGLSLLEIEEQLGYEDLNYSEDEQSDLISAKSNCLEIKESDNVSKLKLSKSVKSSITETTESILNNDSFNKDSDNSPRSSRKYKNIKATTPKFGKNNESFGKISPKLSAIGINPNNFKEFRTTYVSTPKSTSEFGKYETSSSFKPNNLNGTFSNDLETSKNKDIESSVSYSNRNNTQVSLGLNNGLLDPNKNFIINSEKSGLDDMAMGIPMLSGGGTANIIDLSKSIKPRHVSRAKLNAIKYIQRNGPIKKGDPNSTKYSSDKKRKIESVLGLEDDTSGSSGNDQNMVKKSKLQESEFISDRFKKMMAMTSKYAGLLEQHDNEEKEKYFKKLEIKEQMEEKMANTHKVKCKAVRCLQCKYISFSASELCKNERHPLKIFDALKRFYKCSNCQNRTVTLELIPTRSCNNCGSSKWEKTGMMKEKIAVVQHNLSIRGGEQKFINSNIADANLDLLVPDN